MGRVLAPRPRRHRSCGLVPLSSFLGSVRGVLVRVGEDDQRQREPKESKAVEASTAGFRSVRFRAGFWMDFYFLSPWVGAGRLLTRPPVLVQQNRIAVCRLGAVGALLVLRPLSCVSALAGFSLPFGLLLQTTNATFEIGLCIGVLYYCVSKKTNHASSSSYRFMVD